MWGRRRRFGVRIIMCLVFARPLNLSEGAYGMHHALCCVCVICCGTAHDPGVAPRRDVHPVVLPPAASLHLSVCGHISPVPLQECLIRPEYPARISRVYRVISQRRLPSAHVVAAHVLARRPRALFIQGTREEGEQVFIPTVLTHLKRPDTPLSPL